MMFARAKTESEIIIRLRRWKAPVRAVRIGELNAYASANTVTSWPAPTMLVCRSAAMSGSRPAIMKLSVPTANVPNASQYSGAREVGVVVEFIAVPIDYPTMAADWG